VVPSEYTEKWMYKMLNIIFDTSELYLDFGMKIKNHGMQYYANT
jgi:hypothetical protein